ncbi:MAG: hypothetical protein JO121_06310 [Deltaproteobacteria bacterium]|nr:hypothetical protein [Deltaproteobacteria bacterium]
MKPDGNPPLDSIFERELDWGGGPQRQSELCIASVWECRRANGVFASRYGPQPEVIALRKPLGTGK